MNTLTSSILICVFGNTELEEKYRVGLLVSFSSLDSLGMNIAGEDSYLGIQVQASEALWNLDASPTWNPGIASVLVSAAEILHVKTHFLERRVYRSRCFVKRGEDKVELFLSSGHCDDWKSLSFNSWWYVATSSQGNVSHVSQACCCT